MESLRSVTAVSPLMALTASDQPNHQTQQSGKPVCVLASFWLIYAVPDFPQSDTAVLCGAPMTKESLISLPVFRDSYHSQACREQAARGTPTPASSSEKNPTHPAAIAFISAGVKQEKKRLLNNKSWMNMFFTIAIYEHELLQELQIKTNTQSVSHQITLIQSFCLKPERRLHLHLRLIAKTAPAVESVSFVRPR